MYYCRYLDPWGECHRAQEPLASLKGSEVWASMLKAVVVSWVYKDSELGARTRGPQDLLGTNPTGSKHPSSRYL